MVTTWSETNTVIDSDSEWGSDDSDDESGVDFGDEPSSASSQRISRPSQESKYDWAYVMLVVLAETYPTLLDKERACLTAFKKGAFDLIYIKGDEIPPIPHETWRINISNTRKTRGRERYILARAKTDLQRNVRLAERKVRLKRVKVAMASLTGLAAIITWVAVKVNKIIVAEINRIEFERKLCRIQLTSAMLLVVAISVFMTKLLDSLAQGGPLLEVSWLVYEHCATDCSMI